MSDSEILPNIESCSDSELQALAEVHAEYEALEQLALADGPGASAAHEKLVAAVPLGVVYHFKRHPADAESSANNGEAGYVYHAYRVDGVGREIAAAGGERYFVRYTPLYEGASEPSYRRLLVGTLEGEEGGWLMPVQKATYQGPRFVHSTS